MKKYVFALVALAAMAFYFYQPSPQQPLQPTAIATPGKPLSVPQPGKPTIPVVRKPSTQPMTVPESPVIPPVKPAEKSPELVLLSELAQEIRQEEKRGQELAAQAKELKSKIDALNNQCEGIVWAIQTADGFRQPARVSRASVTFSQVEENGDIIGIRRTQIEYVYASGNLPKDVQEGIYAETKSLDYTNLSIVGRSVTLSSREQALSPILKSSLVSTDCGGTTILEIYHLAAFSGTQPLFAGPIEDWDLSTDLALEAPQLGVAKRHSDNMLLCFTFVSMDQTYDTAEKKAVIRISVKNHGSCSSRAS